MPTKNSFALTSGTYVRASADASETKWRLPGSLLENRSTISVVVRSATQALDGKTKVELIRNSEQTVGDVVTPRQNGLMTVSGTFARASTLAERNIAYEDLLELMSTPEVKSAFVNNEPFYS